MKKTLALTAIFLLLSAPIVLAGPLAGLPCNGNFDGDLDVDADDVTEFLVHFGRSQYNDPCPASPCPITCEGTLSPLGRWCEQNNGTVKDMTTGLVWLKKADWGGGKPWVNVNDATCIISWDDANTRAGTLYAGMPGADLSDGSVQGDWRLPTKSEIVGITVGVEKIYNDQQYFFTNVLTGTIYWSSTTEAVAPHTAWFVWMNGNVPSYMDKRFYAIVWPVRGGQ